MESADHIRGSDETIRKAPSYLWAKELCIQNGGGSFEQSSE